MEWNIQYRGFVVWFKNYLIFYSHHISFKYTAQFLSILKKKVKHREVKWLDQTWWFMTWQYQELSPCYQTLIVMLFSHTSLHKLSVWYFQEAFKKLIDTHTHTKYHGRVSYITLSFNKNTVEWKTSNYRKCNFQRKERDVDVFWRLQAHCSLGSSASFFCLPLS